MSNDDPVDTPKVGYRRPPIHTRFKPGQSGNPKGRTRGLRNLATDLKDVLRQPIRITEGGKTRVLTRQQALLLRLFEKALKGDARPLDTSLRLAAVHNNDDPSAAAAREAPLSAEDQALLDEYVQERQGRPEESAPEKEEGEK